MAHLHNKRPPTLRGYNHVHNVCTNISFVLTYPALQAVRYGRPECQDRSTLIILDTFLCALLSHCRGNRGAVL